MSCFGFKWGQSDNRLNIHSAEERPRISQPLAPVPRPDSMAKQSLSRRRSDASIKKAAKPAKPTKPTIDTTPLRPGKETRPAGLFADVKSPLLGQANSPIKHIYHSERRGNMAPPDRQLADRARRHPAHADKANKVLGISSEPNLRSHQAMAATRSNESLGVRTAVAVPKSAMAKERTHKEKRVRRPKAVELPGSFHDVMEKQIVLAPGSDVGSDVRSMERNDSAAELPADVKSDDMSFGPVELPAEDVTMYAVELEGSNPYVAEFDAGPPPPTELPASFTFMEEKMKMNQQELLMPTTYMQEKHISHDIPIHSTMI